MKKVFHPKDANGKEIKAGHLVSVQAIKEPVKVYKYKSQLWFKPYGKPELVNSYFSNDMLIVK